MDLSLVTNAIVLVIFITFSVFHIQKNFRLFFLLIPFYFQALTTILSLAYIETGMYISEQDRDGYFIGAGIYFILFFMLTIILLDKGFLFLNKHVVFKTFSFSFKGKDADLRVVENIMLFALALLFLNVFLSPSPLLDDSINQFSYWSLSKLSFLRNIFGHTSIFIPFITGLIFLKDRKKGIIYLLIYFSYLVLIGQKFGPFINGFYAFFLPSVLLLKKFSTVKIRAFFNYKILFVFGLLLFLVAYKYSLRNPFENIGADTVLKAIIYRAFGLQAHLFWGSLEQFALVNPNQHTWQLTDLNEGMHHLMRYFWPGNIKDINAAINNNFSFTNAYPAILFKIFPIYLVYLVHIVLIIFLLLPISWIFNQLVLKQKIFLSVVAFQFYFWSVYAFTMGYFYKLKYAIALILFLSLTSFLIQKIKSKHAEKSIE